MGSFLEYTAFSAAMGKLNIPSFSLSFPSGSICSVFAEDEKLFRALCAPFTDRRFSYSGSAAINRPFGVVLAKYPFFNSLSVSEAESFYAMRFPGFNIGKANRLMRELEIDPQSRVKRLSSELRNALFLTLELSRAPESIIIENASFGDKRELMFEAMRDFTAPGSSVLFFAPSDSDIVEFADVIAFFRQAKLLSVISRDELSELVSLRVEAGELFQIAPGDIVTKRHASYGFDVLCRPASERDYLQFTRDSVTPIDYFSFICAEESRREAK